MNKLFLWILLSLMAAALTVWLLWSNFSVEVTGYTVTHPNIPQPFSGYRIVQVSDLHNCRYGKDNTRLLELISRENPDIILITGDMIDSRMTNTEIALAFAKEAVKIAPVYYVPGNHEARLEVYAQFRLQLAAEGVTLLENTSLPLNKDDAHITLMGIVDPGFLPELPMEAYPQGVNSMLSCMKPEGYTILLSHRPEFFEIYVSHGANLVFSGHAHGGQVRLPGIGGMYAPGQGFFPRYDAGLFTKGDTTMVVSRGVGSKVILPRVNNRPEIVVVELLSSNG